MPQTVCLTNPFPLPLSALVKTAANAAEEDQIIPIHQLDPVLYHTIPKLKQQAVSSWWVGAKQLVGGSIFSGVKPHSMMDGN